MATAGTLTAHITGWRFLEDSGQHRVDCKCGWYAQNVRLSFVEYALDQHIGSTFTVDGIGRFTTDI
jgi:hypothetical protein